MARVPEHKSLPRILPVASQVSNIGMPHMRDRRDIYVRAPPSTGKLHQVSSGHINTVREELEEEIAPESPNLNFVPMIRMNGQHQLCSGHTTTVREEFGEEISMDSPNLNFVPVIRMDGKDSVFELEELTSGPTTSIGMNQKSEEGGPSCFSGASHPLEPTDKDLMKTVFVPINKSKSEPGYLLKSLSVKGPFMEDLLMGPTKKSSPNIFSPTKLKSLSVKGPFMEDLSIGPSKKSSPSMFSPTDSIVEEPDVMEALTSPMSVQRASEDAEDNCLVPESEENECVWDASLPPSPHSSMDSVGVFPATSNAITFGSTYRSDAVTVDSMHAIEKNVITAKGGLRGDFLDSAKTSISRASDSSGLSDDSNWSNITGSANKPHKGNDPRWKAILAIRARDGILGMSHFRLLRKLGCGDIGNVYLSELSGTRCYFAMKVMDKESLENRKKLLRAQTEREILQLLDHPFLPTLYTHFETDRFTCLVMEFCPGGDLHTLRQRQPGKYFSEYAARFYTAEVLLALEYLHMLGIIYRDLKPENVLVREDGHIMLSDFDLSLRCSFSPTLIKTSSNDGGSGAAFCVQPTCTEPSSACIQPSCFIPRLFPLKNKKKTGRPRAEPGISSGAMPELVAEPTSARSMSFVGTHEYLAPEIIKGEGHGSAVDWWTLGIFLHELLYGKTPFKGPGNRATLFNVVGEQLKFPDAPVTSKESRDLIKALLVKEPQNRLGVKRGATEIKQHPFFEGVNWALIRCSTPPQIPRPVDMEMPGKAGPPDTVGFGGVAKRIPGPGPGPGPDANTGAGGKYLDFEFF